MRDWQSMETAPKDGRQILVRLSNGRECIAEYWDGPPGKDDWGGWATCMTGSYINGTLREDCEAQMESWRPFPNEETWVHPQPECYLGE